MPYWDVVEIDKETKDTMFLYHKNKCDMGLIHELLDIPSLKSYEGYSYMCIICGRSLQNKSRNSHIRSNNHKRNYIKYYEREKNGESQPAFKFYGGKF